MSPSIRWRIAVPYVALVVVVMGGLLVFLSDMVRDAYLDRLEAQLESEARLIGDAITPALAEDDATLLNAEARRYAHMLDARVTIIDSDGVVLGESHTDPAGMDNHLRRPEVQEAVESGQGRSLRFSRTVGYEMLYVALPFTSQGQTIGFVRVALPLEEIQQSISRLHRAIILAALLAIGVAGGLAVLIAERTARPIHRLTGTVERMANGDLNARLLPITRDEVGTLTRAFNKMAARLRGTINMLIEERGRLTTVLDTMADGVIITDGDGRVRLINPAAVRMLAADESNAMGRSFPQVARDYRIIELWRACRSRPKTKRIEPMEVNRGDFHLRVIVTGLQEADPGSCLVILQDLTQIRRLETVRQDFISNISHELRTPLASLKALVDTLRDGALEDPPAAQRFLDRMDTEVDALTQMVRELLELSRIESGRVPFQLSPVDVVDVVVGPTERLRPQAERAGLELTIDLPDELPQVLADGGRIQEVVTNLVHNAIKFTPPGGTVRVTATAISVSSDGACSPTYFEVTPDPLSPGRWVLILVEDTGVGIPADDLSRIFERFYKADRARSGGGTGLGLSIAKHIVQGHGGSIWADSIEGEGTTFYVALPLLTTS